MLRNKRRMKMRLPKDPFENTWQIRVSVNEFHPQGFSFLDKSTSLENLIEYVIIQALEAIIDSTQEVSIPHELIRMRDIGEMMDEFMEGRQPPKLFIADPMCMIVHIPDGKPHPIVKSILRHRLKHGSAEEKNAGRILRHTLRMRAMAIQELQNKKTPPSDIAKAIDQFKADKRDSTF